MTATSSRSKRRVAPIVLVVIVLVVLGFALFPVYWMLVTATTDDGALFGDSAQWLPNFTNMGSFADVIGGGTIRTWLTNSLIIAVGNVILSTVLAVHAAYAFSRFRFRGKSVGSMMLFVTQMLPEALLVVPIFAIFSMTGLLDNYLGLIIANAAFTIPILTLILKSAIDSVPPELDEAAKIDGCSYRQVLWRVVLPVIGPSLAAVSVIAFFSGWNEYVFALTFTQSTDMRTASVGLASFVGELATPIQTVMAVAFMYTLPAVVFYLMVQKFIVAGLAAGSVKG